MISLRAWWVSFRASVATSYRQARAYLTNLRNPPPRPGITVGTVATSPQAEAQLSAISQSPEVYAGVMRRAYGLASYPVRVSLGYGAGQAKEILDAARVPWVGDLLRILSRPNPADEAAIFPADPGETMFAQLVADLLLVGSAYARVQLGSRKQVIGLHRLHPGKVKLVRSTSGDYWEYSTSYGKSERYERGEVAHLRGLSWEQGGAGELGTGAAESLSRILAAQSAALTATATVTSQGGPDIVVTGKSPATAAFMRSKEGREQIARDVTDALRVDGSGRRVLVLSQELELKDSGLKPADMQAPELMTQAKAAILMALGCTPVSVGSVDGAAYATAVAQQRVQAELDGQLALIVEACLLRPLARVFAKAAGGRWATKADQVSAWFDLSSHPGNQAARTEAMSRMMTLVQLGWTAEQAAEAEGIELPPPEGQPMPIPAPAPAPQTPTEPRQPADGVRTLGELFGRAVEAPEAAPEPDGLVRAWQDIETRRARADADLTAASEMALSRDRDRYAEAVGAALRARVARALVREEDWAGLTADVVLPAAEPGIYQSELSPPWAATWTDVGADALTGIAGAESVPVVDLTPGALEPLIASTQEIADTSWAEVYRVVQEGLDQGLTVQEIQDRIRAATTWSPARALAIARTETVRAQSSGTDARYAAATEAGLDIVQQWLAGTPTPTQRPEHRALNGQIIEIGQRWTFRDGVQTLGPGLSGQPEHDVNCRCAKRALLRSEVT